MSEKEINCRITSPGNGVIAVMNICNYKYTSSNKRIIIEAENNCGEELAGVEIQTPDPQRGIFRLCYPRNMLGIRQREQMDSTTVIVGNDHASLYGDTFDSGWITEDMERNGKKTYHAEITIRVGSNVNARMVFIKDNHPKYNINIYIEYRMLANGDGRVFKKGSYRAHISYESDDSKVWLGIFYFIANVFANTNVLSEEKQQMQMECSVA
jgi:hypothetical protein